MYKRIAVYYFSGTGNALKAARWFAEHAQKRGMRADLIPIDRFKTPIAPPPSGDTLIGFLYPTHGFCLPWYMLKFMLLFPRGRNQLFCMNTFAGSILGKLPLPGLSGIALLLPAIILAAKGYSIRGLLSLNLPSNWISVHPGFTKRAVSLLADHCGKKTEKYAAILFSGKRAYNGLISLPIDLAVSPIAVVYLFVGRFWLAKLFMANSDCTNCGICAHNCPTNALIMKNDRPFWTYRCENCMRCMNICPEKAIQTSYTFAVISNYVLYGMLLPFVMMIAMRYSETAASIISSKSFTISRLIRAWIILSIMFLGYRLVLRLLRFKPFDFIFARFTPTNMRSWSRYLAPGVSVKDFNIKKDSTTRKP